MKTIWESPSSGKIHSASMVQFLRRYLFRKWIWIGLAGILGTGIGVLIVMAANHPYKSEVSFLVAPEIVDQQEIRFGSRDLIFEAAQRLEFGGISYSIDDDWWRKKEIYRHTPVKIELEMFPEHLFDLEMKMELLAGGKFRFKFTDLQGQDLVGEGQLGGRFKFGGIVFTPQPTTFYQKSWVGKTIYFTVHSETKMVSKFRRGLRVERLLKHPSKISVFYTDVNHLRVLDFLESLTDVYREDWEQQLMAQNQLALVDLQINDLMGELRRKTDSKDILQLVGERIANKASDTLIGKLDSLRLQTTVLDRRIELLEASRETSFPMAEYFAPFVQDSKDSLLISLNQRLLELTIANQENDFDEISSKTNKYKLLRATLLEKDRLSREAIEKNLRETQALLAARIQVRKRFLLEGFRDVDMDAFYAWEQLFQLIERREEILINDAVNMPKVRFLESPHVLPFQGGYRKGRLVVTTGLASLILALCFFLARAMNTDRLLMQQQLAASFDLPILHLGKEEGREVPPAKIRELHAAIEIHRESEDRLWIFGGQQPVDAQGKMVDGFAKRQAMAGNTVLLIRGQEGQVPLEIPSIPAPLDQTPSELTILSEREALALWLISSQAEDLVQQALGQYDFVFMDLPDLSTYPEGVRRIQQSDIFIHIISAGEAKRSDIAQLHELLPGTSPKKYFVWVG